MPLSEERLRHIEAQIEAANTEDDWFQLGHEHIEELVAALREPGIKIPLDMARRLRVVLGTPGDFMWDTAEQAEQCYEDDKELSRLIREEERCQNES